MDHSPLHELEPDVPPSLRFRVGFSDVDDDVAELHLIGELDCATAADVVATLEAIELIGLTRVDVVTDDLEFVDCSGLKVFDDFALRFAARGGQLRLVDPSPAIARLIAIARDDVRPSRS